VEIIRVCYLGSYLKYSPRHRILIRGLRENGVEVLEINDTSNIALRYPKLAMRYVNSLRCDLVIVGEASNYIMPLAVMLARLSGRPLVFDPFVSAYDTNLDREIYAQQSIASKLYFCLDKYSAKFSDLVLMDTDRDILYWHETFGIELDKFKRAFIGAEEDIFFPMADSSLGDPGFDILFYGSYIPLHGIEYIIQAAKLLEWEKNARFLIIGQGQTYNQISKLYEDLNPGNVSFLKWVDYNQLPAYISQAKVCLGIFGGTDKAMRVIPTKVYQCMAMRKPVVTGASPAINELFRHMDSIILCEMGDPEDLASAILKALNNKELKDAIANNGYRIFLEKLTSKILGSELKNTLNKLI
jgi:glycosyltransferase involved in cell wall biosynthesis